MLIKNLALVFLFLVLTPCFVCGQNSGANPGSSTRQQTKATGGFVYPANIQGTYQPGKGWRSDSVDKTDGEDETKKIRAKQVKTDFQKSKALKSHLSSASREIYVRTTNELLRAIRSRGNKRILLAQGTYDLRKRPNKFLVNKQSGSVQLIGSSCNTTKIIGPGTDASHDFLQLGKGYGQVSIDRLGFENWGTVVRLLKNDHGRINITNCCFSSIANTVGTYNVKLAHGGIESLVFRHNEVRASRLFGINLIYKPNSRLRSIDISKNLIENVISDSSEAVGIGLRADLKPGVVGFTTDDSSLEITDNIVRNVRKQSAKGASVVDGIIVDGFKNVTVQDNKVSEIYRKGGLSHGIYLALVNRCTVTGNTMTNCGSTGFLCKKGWDMEVTNNTVRGGKGSSFRIGRGSRITIAHNTITNGGNRAMYIGGVNGLSISNNVMTENGAVGIPPAQRGSVFLFANQDVTFEDNQLRESIAMAPIRIGGNVAMKNYSIKNNLIYNPNFKVAVEFAFASINGTGSLDNLLIEKNQTAKIERVVGVTSGRLPTSRLIKGNRSQPESKKGG